MPKHHKQTLCADIIPQQDSTSNNKPTPENTQPETQWTATNPPQQQNNGHPIIPTQQLLDTYFNISDIDLHSAFSIQST